MLFEILILLHIFVESDPVPLLAGRFGHIDHGRA